MAASLTPDRAADLVRSWIIDPIAHWVKEQRRMEFVLRAIARREANAAPGIEARADNHKLAREVENAVAAKLQTLGYQVATTGHTAHHDLVVNGALKIEVKASLWRQDTDPQRDRGRYQFNIRPKQAGGQNGADLVILVARNGQDHHFIIPAAQLGRRRSVTIREQCPDRYAGQWASYRENWQLIGPALASARQRPHQIKMELTR